MESPILKQIEQQSEALSQAEILDLAARLIEIAKTKNIGIPTSWGNYDGILDPKLDPLEYQRTVRQGWG